MSESILEDKLDDFMIVMLDKFLKRKERHGEWSVTNNYFPWAAYPLDRIEDHLEQEVLERFPRAINVTRQELTDEQKMQEDIDIANMAFLDWSMRRARQHG